MRILVTGGTGFIGSALCRHLAGELGHEVLIVDRLAHAGSLASLRSIGHEPAGHFAQADICDRAAMDWLFDAFHPEGVVHLPSARRANHPINASGAFAQADFLGTAVLLEAARAFWTRLPSRERDDFRLLHVETNEVSGQPGLSRHDPASASKVAAAHLVNAWTRAYGLPVIVASCSANVYGPYQCPEEVIPLTIVNALDGWKVPVHGDGSNVRDWLYVEDLARALSMTLTDGRPGEIYPVRGDGGRRNIEMARRICAVLDELNPGPWPHESRITFLMDRTVPGGHDLGAATTLETELGWTASETLETGLEKTVRWFLANEWWWRLPQEPAAADERRVPEMAGELV